MDFNPATPYITTTPEGIRLRIHVQPNASKNQIVGLHGEALKIKIKAPPEDGKANAELCEFLAGKFKIAKSKVTVVSGHTSRAKVISISGITEAEVVATIK